MIRRGFALLPAAVALLCLPRPLAGAAGQALVPIPPCRAVDTRSPAGPNGGPSLAANETRLFTITGTCGVPSNALGLAVNLTVVAAGGTGFAQLYAGDAAVPPPTHVLIFSAGQTRAASTMVALASDASGTVALANVSPGPDDFIIDIAGYWVLACTSTIGVTNPSAATGVVNAPFSQTFTSSGGTGAKTYSTTSTLPAGLTLAANGTLSGTPTQNGTFPITVTATDANGCTGTGSTYTLVIACQSITVTNPGVTTGTANAPFSQTFTQSGGVGTTTFSTSSPLPIGMTLAANGVLAGTPTQSGAFDITVVATDADGCTGAGATYPLVITCPPVVVSITPTPAQVCSGGAGNTASATPGFLTYSWAITNGTIQGSKTGASISYTAGVSGNVGLTVVVTDAFVCPGQATLNVPITAIPAPPTIAASNPQSFTVSGGVGTFTLTFNGQTTAPLAYNASAASVQAALVALASIGGVGGTVVVTAVGGAYTVAFGGPLAGPQPLLTASGAGGCTVAVDPPAVCADSTGNLAVGPAGATAYAWVITNGTITSASNIQTITYTAGSSGTVKLDLTVTNPGGCTAENSLDVTINAAPATPTITPTPSPVCGNSTGNTASGLAGATTYAWSITNGTIMLGGSSQTVTYTAGSSGNVSLTLTVTNATGCSAQGSLDVPITAAPATPTITPTPASVCANSTGNGASGPAGATTYAWSITNGTIQGSTTGQSVTYTAGASGNVGLTLLVTNASGCSSSNSQNVPINPTPAFTPAAGALPLATHGLAYPLTFSGTGGTGPYSFLLTSGALPAGMTLTSGGTVTPNVPNATGAFAFSITVTDSRGCSSTQAYTLNVQPNLQPDSYSVVGNTQLFIAGVAGAPTTPAVSSLSGVLANDTPVGGIAVTAATTACGGIGGSITMDSAGRFIYTPPVGTTGVASCSYTGTSNTIAAVGTISITLTNMVWYVDNASGGSHDGRSNTPLTTMTAVGGAATNNGDLIYVAHGSGSTTGAYTMKTSQQLIGAGATLTVGPLTVAGNAASTPTLSGTLTLASSVVVNGIDMSTGSSTAITGTSVTGISVTARSISSSGAPNGIFLSTMTGSFTVTGDGSDTSVGGNGTGGTISNATGADGATAGSAIYLNNVQNVTLRRMTINGTNQNYAIRGLSVSGFTLEYSTIAGTNGTSNTADQDAGTLFAGEGSLRFTDLTGSVSILSSVLDGGFSRTMAVHNSSGTMNLTIDNSTVRDTSTNAATTDAFFMQASNAATMNLTVQNNSLFTAYRQNAIQTDARDTSTMSINISNSVFSNSNAALISAGGSLLLGSSASTDTLVQFNIHDDSFRHGAAGSGVAPNNGGAHLVCGTVSGAGKFDGKFVNNTVGVTGVAFSGAGNGADALRVFASGNKAGTTRVTGTTDSRFLIRGNTIKNYGEAGIQINARQGNSVLDATVFGNAINEPGSSAGGAFAGIWVNTGALPGDANIVNIAIGDASVSANKNAIQGSDPSLLSDVFLENDSSASATLNLYKNGSASSTLRQVVLDDNNPAPNLDPGGLWLSLGGGTTNLVAGTPPTPP